MNLLKLGEISETSKTSIISISIISIIIIHIESKTIRNKRENKRENFFIEFILCKSYYKLLFLV